MRHHKIFFPGKAISQHTLTQRVTGSGIGAVILDGGIGGQSSYPGGVEEYLQTTYTPLKKIKHIKGSGVGLDKLTNKLSSLNIKPPDRTFKKKPIAFSI